MNYVLNEKINLSYESIYNINTFRIYMIKIFLIGYIYNYVFCLLICPFTSSYYNLEHL